MSGTVSFLRTPRRRAVGGLPALVGLTVLMVCASACSIGDGGVEAEQTSVTRSTASVEPMSEPAPLTVRMGVTSGPLSLERQERAAERVAGVVDSWIDQAWVQGPWPRTVEATSSVWGIFTSDGARLAARHNRTTSGAHYAQRVDEVVATRRVLRVDLFASGGHARGATVRVTLDLEVTPIGEESAQQVILRGRLFLTKEQDGQWRVFGHDLARGGW